MPRVAKPDVEAYLDRLARREASPVAIAAVPDVDRRSVDYIILQSIVRAIRDRCEIEIDYRSPRALSARRYRISPHALLHDGFRWSVRCHIRGETGDHWGEMVLDRIEEVAAETWPAAAALSGGDEDWQSIIELELVPNPGLDAAGRSLIEAQYGMQNGRKIVRVRRCMLAYFLKRYQLDEPATLKAPHQAPLALRDRAMVTGVAAAGDAGAARRRPAAGRGVAAPAAAAPAAGDRPGDIGTRLRNAAAAARWPSRPLASAVSPAANGSIPPASGSDIQAASSQTFTTSVGSRLRAASASCR